MVAASVALLIAFVAFATVGALVASRQPRNAVGWIFLASGCSSGSRVAGGEYANYVVRRASRAPARRAYVAGWLVRLDVVPGCSALIVVRCRCSSPTAASPARRWRPVLWGLRRGDRRSSLALSMVNPGPLNDDRTRRPGPTTRSASRRSSVLRHGRGRHGRSSLLALLVGAAASVIVRFRRSRGDERQQLKWMAYAVVVMVVSRRALDRSSAATSGDLAVRRDDRRSSRSRSASRCSATGSTRSTASSRGRSSTAR